MTNQFSKRASARHASSARGDAPHGSAPVRRVAVVMATAAIGRNAVAEAVAARWTAIGVKTRGEASQPQAFFQNRDAHRYSAYLAGWNTTGGEAGDPLRALVATPDRERGLGGTNRGRYSNPAVDALLIEALQTIDAERRRALLSDASRLALDDFAVLPLYFEMAGWLMRRGFTYPGRTDQFTLAAFITPAP